MTLYSEKIKYIIKRIKYRSSGAVVVKLANP